MISVNTEANRFRIVAKVSEHLTKQAIQLEKKFRKALVAGTNDWRRDVRRLLSRPYRRDQINTSQFPRKRSGLLERSLRYKTRVTRSKKYIRATIYRRFEPFNKNGFDYATYLNEQTNKPYGGYQERIYRILEDRVSQALDRANS
jgi:hypothetical protein